MIIASLLLLLLLLLVLLILLPSHLISLARPHSPTNSCGPAPAWNCGPDVASMLLMISIRNPPGGDHISINTYNPTHT